MPNNRLIVFGLKQYQVTIHQLNALSDAVPPLLLRLILAWEFGEAGIEKLHGTNWFADLSFPFPFNLLPAEISWGIATWFEIIGALALVFGLATRFFTFSLMMLTIVAIATVHWPEHWNNLSQLLTGYRIIDESGDGFGNYKLPLIYLVMFSPLLFAGAGRWSVDCWIQKKLKSG